MKALQPKRFLRDESGSTAVEFGMIGLLVIVLCVATLEFGRALHLTNELAFAADRGSRLVLLNPDVPDADVVAEVRANLRMANTAGLEILTSRESHGAQATRGLSVSLPLTLLIPTPRLQNFRLSVQRRVPAP
ncbi:MAG: TadE/TadG family type IV pilus assembly protein [Pararhodobacter sp.]